jgi:hypothetical protein
MYAGAQPNKIFTMWLIVIILIIKVFLITTKSPDQRLFAI